MMLAGLTSSFHVFVMHVVALEDTGGKIAESARGVRSYHIEEEKD